MTGGRIKRLQPYSRRRHVHADVGRRGLQRRLQRAAGVPPHARQARDRDRRPSAGALRPPGARGRRRSSSSPKSRRRAKAGSTAPSSCCEPGVFDYIDGDTTPCEREPLERLAADGQLMAYRHDGFWQCMDTMRDKAAARRSFGIAAKRPGRCGTETMRVLVTGHRRLYRRTFSCRCCSAAGHDVDGPRQRPVRGLRLPGQPVDVPPDPQGRPRRHARRLRRLRCRAPPRRRCPTIRWATSTRRPPTTSTIWHRCAWPGGQGGRRAAVRLCLVVQPLRRAGDELHRRDAPIQPGDALCGQQGAGRGRHRAAGRRRVQPDLPPQPTAYGFGRLRGDLVVNNLTGYAFTTGEVRMKSDGMPWRPLVHIDDIARAFSPCSRRRASRCTTRRSMSVATPGELPGARGRRDRRPRSCRAATVTFADGAGPTPATTGSTATRFAEPLPGFGRNGRVRQGIEQLYDAYLRTETRPRPSSSSPRSCASQHMQDARSRPGRARRQPALSSREAA